LKQGWAKANKLEGRNTTQGLVGLLIKENAASIVELNCETDFVAKNSNFHHLLNEVAASNLKGGVSKGTKALTEVTSEELSHMKDHKGRPLADLVALNIGQLGENLQIRRGAVLAAGEADQEVAGVTHPSAGLHSKVEVQYGRYGSAMTFKTVEVPNQPDKVSLAATARQICQHIIGMNPARVGDITTFAPPAASVVPEGSDAVSECAELSVEEQEDAEVKRLDDVKVSHHDELIHQDFLLDPDVKVGQILLQSGIRVLDFVRYEVGQDLD